MRGLAFVSTVLCASSALAAADPPAPAAARTTATVEPEPEPEAEPAAAEERKSQFSVAFAGGALVPRGTMEEDTSPGLDVWGRVGWSSPSGLGLVMNLEYAPLRRDPDAQSSDEVVDAHLFAATAGPRLTIGRDVLRVWLAGTAGLVVERIATTAADLSSQVLVESALGVSGGGGLDFCFFGSGGVTVAGAYTRGLSSGATQNYVSLNAGLVFVY